MSQSFYFKSRQDLITLGGGGSWREKPEILENVCSGEIGMKLCG